MGGVLGTAVPSPDGKHLVTISSSGPGPVRVWDVTGPAPRERAVLPNAAGVGAIVGFSPDGKSLVSVSHGGNLGVRVWGLAEREVRLRSQIVMEDGGFRGVRSRLHVGFSPDGKAEAVTSLSGDATDSVVVVLDVSESELKERCRIVCRGIPNTHPSPPVFSADSKTLVAPRLKEKNKVELVTWDVTGAKPKELSAHDLPEGIWDGLSIWGFRSDGVLLAAGGFNGAPTTWEWDIRGPKLKSRPVGGKLGDRISFADFAPDGKTAVSIQDDRQVTVWDLDREKEVWSHTFPGRVPGVKFAPDGKHLITTNSNSTAYVLRLPRK